MDFLKKITSYFKDIKVVVVASNEDSISAEILSRILKPHFSVKKFNRKLPSFFDLLLGEYFVIESDFLSQKFSIEIINLMKISKLPLIAVVGNNRKDNFNFDEKQLENIRLVAKEIPHNGFFIFNSDDKSVSSLKRAVNAKSLIFGFGESADFRASDVIESAEEINFKLNYRGNIVPFWLEKNFGKEAIYDILLSVCVASIFNINIVEISESLKNYSKV